uniref:Putative alpha-L-fucosidase n=1 Tax=Cuerna arida TaxID=1464854 RepID=A0A1B6F165_9HEMI
MARVATLVLIIIGFKFSSGEYKPTWDSIDSRPLPQWYDDAKLGIFIHWGVFSVQSVSSEWAWRNWKENLSQPLIQYIENNYPKYMTYQDFAKEFTAELFNPEQWAKIIHSSGAKYVVLTSKHHEGYTLWPSKYSFSWNSVDVGPHRDLVGELKAALENYTDITFGLYHSMFEWYNPLYLADKAANYSNLSSVNFVDSKIIPEMIELVEMYKPHVLWSDGDWDAPSSYWRSLSFLAWLYNSSPVKDTVVVNDRWGSDTLCKHGGFMTCSDRFNPGVLQKKKWENAMTIDSRSWGYRRTASLADYLSIYEILTNLTVTVSCGGNLLLNVGPTKDGIITPIFEERLTQLGTWMKVNGEAIYKSKPWKVCQNDSMTSGVWYTTNKKMTILYATFSPWPKNNFIKLGCPKFTLNTKVQLLGHPEYLEYLNSKPFVEVKLPNKANVTSEWVWTLKIIGAKNLNNYYEYNSEESFQDGISVTKAVEL